MPQKYKRKLRKDVERTLNKGNTRKRRREVEQICAAGVDKSTDGRRQNKTNSLRILGQFKVHGKWKVESRKTKAMEKDEGRRKRGKEKEGGLAKKRMADIAAHRASASGLLACKFPEIG